MAIVTRASQIESATIERFWAKVNKTPGCWEWTAYTSKRGYGYFRAAKTTVLAHRIAWILTHGSIEADIELDHMCHNHACVNPAHLNPATHKQNMENYVGPRSDNKSGVRGVHWHKQHRKWAAVVNHNKRAHHVGLFTDLADAEAAVVAKRIELYTHNVKDRAWQASKAA